MVWQASAPNAGFSTANRTWLPVRPEQAIVAVDRQGAGSVMSFYRLMLALRKARADLMEGATAFFDLPEPVLGFRRGASTLCLFNLSPKPVAVPLSGGTMLLAQAADAGKAGLTLGPNGFAILDGGEVG